MDLPACDVIVPCRDEAPALAALFDRLDLLPTGFRILIVDNGSSDDTADVARRRGAEVVPEPTAGYGAAVHAGVLAATAPLVAVIDGDGSLDPVELIDLRDRVLAGATMAVGRRRPSRRGVWPWHARAGTAVVAWWLRQRTAVRVHDIAPMRVCRRQDLLDLGVADRRSGYPLELLVKAVAAGWRIEERDVSYGPRARGTRSKVSGSLVGTMKAIRDFVRVVRRGGPARRTAARYGSSARRTCSSTAVTSATAAAALTQLGTMSSTPICAAIIAVQIGLRTRRRSRRAAVRPRPGPSRATNSTPPHHWA